MLVALAVVSIGLASHLVLQPYRKPLLQHLKSLVDGAVFTNLYLRWGGQGTSSAEPASSCG